MLRSIFAFLLLALGFASSPASANCFVGDHNCRFHGQGRAVSDVTSQYGQTGVFIVSTANNGIDFDNQILLPDGHGPYIQSDTGTTPIADQPYSTGLEQFRNVGPENYQNNFQNGTVQATHSGDFNGGERPPSPPGCMVSIGNCEEVYIQGNIPDLGTPEGFEVKQTIQLYNYPGVIDPVTTVTSFAAASGKAYIIDTDHVPVIEPDLFAVPQRQELASRISEKHVDELAGTGAIGIEHTYNIGYSDFDIHAGGLVVFPDQIWKQASDPYRVSVKHSFTETPYGSFYAQEGWQHTNTYTKFDYNLDFRTRDPATGMPVLQESNIVTAQWQTQSGIYGQYATKEALQYGQIVEKQRKRDESLLAEMQIASAMATNAYCTQPNGVCANGQQLPTYKPTPVVINDNGRIPDPLGFDVYWTLGDNGTAYPHLKDDASAFTYPYYYSQITGGVINHYVDNRTEINQEAGMQIVRDGIPAFISGVSRVPTDTAGLVSGVTGVGIESTIFQVKESFTNPFGLINGPQTFDYSQSWNKYTKPYFDASATIQTGIDTGFVNVTNGSYDPDSEASTVFKFFGEGSIPGSAAAKPAKVALLKADGVILYMDDVVPAQIPYTNNFDNADIVNTLYPNIAPNSATIGGKMCVYSCVDADGVTRYVGITNDVKRRGTEHMRTKGIEIEQIGGLDDLSVADAKAVEQVMINYYGLGKVEGGTLLNKINSISSTRNPTAYEQSLARGKELLDSVDYQWTN